MALLKILPILLLIMSCSKLSYVVDQGMGQLALQNKARDNTEILKGPSLRPEQREKIKTIEQYREFFFKFFQQAPHPIYSKTTILSNPEVTTLVITSPINEIKAREECFWVAGCFPYLGFFEKDKALKYARQQEREGYQTYIRPVYAYSTLGYFEDPILSSFFYFNEYDLAELIFHELFHTLFFVKNETSFNENLAQFIGEEMVKIYYKDKESDLNKWLEEKNKRNNWALEVHRQALALQKSYKEKKNNPEEILKDFLANSFVEARQKGCQQNLFPEYACQEKLETWNNARFSSYLTYYNRRADLEAIFKNQDSNLSLFYQFLMKSYERYQKHAIDKSFEEYFLKEGSYAANYISH
jgi:predicted aminopeptidase